MKVCCFRVVTIEGAVYVTPKTVTSRGTGRWRFSLLTSSAANFGGERVFKLFVLASHHRDILSMISELNEGGFQRTDSDRGPLFSVLAGR